MSLTGARPFRDKQEISDLLEALSGTFALRNRALVVLGKTSALRISELLSLTIGDVFGGQSFRHSFQVRRKNMKGKREGRRLPLHPEARQALARWLVSMRRNGASLNQDRPLFPSREGAGCRAMSRKTAHYIITRAAQKAGLEEGISCHSTRKYAAHQVYTRSGNCLIKTAAALGHRGGVATTWRYIRGLATGAESLLLQIE